MMDALYSGITGLNGFQTALNTQSNNIANVNTIAYKSDNISFADQMYQSAIGKGVSVETINKDFLQGNLKVTNGSYDMAIEGKGFFLVKGNTEEVMYTRAGNFYMAEDGTLKLPNGYQVQGIPAQSTAVLSSDANSIFTTLYTKFLGSQIVETQNGDIIETINSKATDYNASAVDDLDTKKGDNYKTREAKIADIEALSSAYRSELNLYSTSPTNGESATSQVSTIPFDMTKLTNSLDSLEITIGTTTYKQQFEESALQTLQNFADRLSKGTGISASVDSTGNMTITSLIPGKDVIVSDANIINGAVAVYPAPSINTVAAITGSGRGKVEAIELALKDAIERADAKYLKLSTVVDASDLATKTTQELQMKLDTLNISESPFGTAEIEDGVIYLKQGDNRFVVGKVVTAVFSNELGLTPEGGNVYSATVASGDMIFATIENKVLSKTLELSNSDLSQGLVDLMVFQRAFEANSKSVTTSDEFLKTALALKK
jgi:flagellar hook protein FlgE